MKVMINSSLIFLLYYVSGDKRSTSDIEHLNCDQLQIDRVLCGNLFQRVAQMKCMVLLRSDGPGRNGICSKKETSSLPNRLTVFLWKTLKKTFFKPGIS